MKNVLPVFGMLLGLVGPGLISALHASVENKDGVPVVLPDGPMYSQKIDFAKLEANYPIPADALAKLTPEALGKWDQESLDQLYARLSSGPIPSGAYRGKIIFAKGGGVTRLQEFAKGIQGVNVVPLPQVPGVTVEKMLGTFGELIWKGKFFDRSEMVLRNLIDPKFLALAKQYKIAGEVKLNPKYRDTFEGNTVYKFFPARLYCGQSLFDSRRESVIIDYAYSHDIEGYQAGIDKLADRAGMAIRDEIRMVRPGFYLGRAYASRAFVLNFTLENEETAKRASAQDAQDECWSGTQARRNQ